MNNKGRIVVFISMITAVFLVLITLCFQVVILSAVKSKTVIAGKLAVSDQKARYNEYIFEHYHILLFDKTAGERGEAFLEQQLEKDYVEKLGRNYTDSRVEITSFSMLLDNDCKPFKEQINEYMVYALAEHAAQAGVDAIKEKTEGKDGTLPEELKEDMQDAQKHESEEQPGHEEDESPVLQPDAIQNVTEERDPRDYTKRLSSSAVLNLVLPGDKTISDATITLTQELPSFFLGGWFMEFQEVDRNFDDMSGMLEGLEASSSWQDSLVDSGSLALYIQEVCNSYIKQVNDTAVLSYEQEYLIAGQASDYENLKSVVHRIIGIRFPINFISLCSQVDKKATIESIAKSIGKYAPYLIPALKYLITGCWAYVESIADVKVLMDGKKAAFIKTSANWITDIRHIGESLSKETEDVENGLDYQAYLTILQLMHIDGTMHRVLDLMQINAQQEHPEFKIRHAAVGLEADFETSYEGVTYDCHQVGKY